MEKGMSRWTGLLLTIVSVLLPALSPNNLMAEDLPLAPLGSSLDHAIDLGVFDGSTVINGELDDGRPDVFYKLTIGCGGCEEWERTRFDTPRKLIVSAQATGPVDEIGLELRINPNGSTSGEVLSDAVTSPGLSRIEIPDLESGVYYIRLFKKAAKVDFRLSIAIAPLPFHKDGAGNDPQTAKNLGLITGRVVVKDFINDADQLDFYRFRLKTPTSLSVVLDGLHQGDVELSVLKSSASSEEEMESLGSSDYDGDSSEELFLKELPKGDYLVKVSQVSGSSDYVLRLEPGENRLPDKAGDTFERALNIGKLENDKSFRGYLDEKNGIDIYRFRVEDAREVWISRRTFGQLTAKMDVLKRVPCDGGKDCEQVLSDSPSSTYWGGDDGTEIRYFNFLALGTGEYFVRIQRESGEAPYSLSVTSKPTLDTAGDNLETSRRLADVDAGSSAYGFVEYVGKLDPVDVFRVAVKQTGGATFKICGLDAEAHIELARIAAPQVAVAHEPGCTKRPQYGPCCREIHLSSSEYLLKISQAEGAAMYSIFVKPLIP
jgi:hypothetical protein